MASPNPGANWSTQKGHSRTSSSKNIPLPRRLTKGPLGDQDPISVPVPVISDSSPKQAKNSASVSRPFENPSTPILAAKSAPNPPKDFTYLQQPSGYHPLPSLDLPPSLQQPPFTQLNPANLLSTSRLRSAALSAVQTLCTSSSLAPPEIFDLVYVRLSCVSLLDLNLAAQESKLLGDVNSEFYCENDDDSSGLGDLEGAIQANGMRNILPWELRVLTVRLQAIGYRDMRAGVIGYYELAREGRQSVARLHRLKKEHFETEEDESAKEGQHAQRDEIIWHQRLKELGIMVGNALIEMGDLAAARRHLESLAVADGKVKSSDETLLACLTLLSLQMGDIPLAERHLVALKSSQHSDPSSPPPLPLLLSTILGTLFSLSQSSSHESVTHFRTLLSSLPPSSPHIRLLTNNIAVCLLYEASIDEAIPLLENLLEEYPESVKTMPFNLATMYELTGERAMKKKMDFAERLNRRLIERGEGGLGERGMGDALKL